MKSIRITVYCFFIWWLAAFVNTILFIVVFGWGGLSSGEWVRYIPACFAGSLLFSIPASFVLWMVLLFNTYHPRLTSVALRTALVLAVLTSFFTGVIPNEIIHEHYFLFSLNIVAAALTAVLLLGKNLNKINCA